MKAGRKREFEAEQALQKAMFTFWQKGFVGTSLTDLTSSMGINKPSLYSAFGNKEKLFITATDYYTKTYAQPSFAKLQANNKSVKQRLNDFLLAVIQNQCDPQLPSGCFVSLCASEAAGDCMPQSAIDAIRSIQSFTDEHLKEFFENEKTQGNLPASLDVTLAALYTTTIIHGAASMARSDKTLDEIKLIIEPAVESIISM